MYRSNMSVRGLAVLVALAVAAFAPAQQTQPASTSVNADQAAELQRARTIITDTKASEEVRRIGAVDLLNLGYPAATDLAIEILRTNSDALPRVAICEAVAVVGTRRPDLLDNRLVDPLLDLLASPNEPLRSKAAVSLSAFPDGGIAHRLGKLAADADAPRIQQLAAVDALAPNVDQRPVSSVLIALLDQEDAELRDRVVAALRPASRADYGADIEAWRQWWQRMSTLDEAGWLRDRVALSREKYREIQRQMASLRAQSESRSATLSTRLIEQLNSFYHLTPQAQKDDLLVRWLEDPLVEFRKAAMNVIATNIADGNRPGEPVRAALLGRFDDSSAALRRDVLDVVAALTDPADAERVLSRLAEERDPTVREVALRTLGRLQNPVAIPALIAELNKPDATPGCWAEAAVSLGMVGARSRVDLETITPAIEPLKLRFASAPDGAQRLRVAVLGAMADIGAAEFADEFIANLEAANPDLLLTALQGIRVLGNATRNDRILALMGHDDARVRRAAAETMGTVGTEAAHLAALLNRLNPATEPNERVRQTSWASFRALLARKQPAERLTWVDRLRGLPGLEEAYLIELIADLAARNPAPAELTDARWRLAMLLHEAGRFADAVPGWRELWQTVEATDSPHGKYEAGRYLLQATLETQRYDKIGDVLTSLLADQDAGRRGEVVQVLLEHLGKLQPQAGSPELSPLLDVVDQLPAEAVGDQVRQAAQLLRPPPAPAPEAEPSTQPAAG